MKETRYKYKALYHNPINNKTMLTDYSPMYKKKELAFKWYNEFGKKLEDMFDRELILVDYEMDV